MADTEERKSRDDFLALARKRFQQASDDERAIRLEAEKDLRFVAGEQWDERVKMDRINNGRPALTFSRCHTFVQQVANEARQQKPQIKYVPAEDGDKDTAEIYEGLARHIQYSSDAQIAYETAVEYSAGGSFGYYRFLTDYCDDDSFDLELKVVPVVDPFSVYGILIPSCFNMEPKYAFVVEELPIEEFKRQYPDSETETMGFDQAAKRAQGWVGTDTIRVAEYWYIEEKDEELKKGDKTRTVTRKTVKYCKMNGAEVLKDTETEWPGYCIPIIPVTGKQVIVGGKPNLFSVVRFQRDPQQLINFYKTRVAETMGTAPIQPYLVEEGQIKGHEREWETMNTKLRPYLVYKGANDATGKPYNAPQRQVFEAPIAALSQAAAQEIDDMKATAGIFDASIGSQGNETSGLAIARRQQQSNITNMHFMDNLERAFKKGGVVMADVIPKIYDAPRMIRILGADETPKIVRVNEPHADANGRQQHYKIGGEGVGKYDIVVTMGKAFSTKRMESFDMMTQVIQASPQVFPMIADIFFRNSDLAGADQLADRFKRMLPPQLQDDGDSDPKQQVAVLQAQLAQLQQQHQAIDAFAAKLQKEQEAKVVENSAKVQVEQMKADTSLAIEKMKIEAQVAIAEINTKAQNERERIKLEADLNAKLAVQDREQAHDLGMAAVNQAHESSMADKQHAQTLEQQDQAGQQAMMQQQMAAENQQQNSNSGE